MYLTIGQLFNACKHNKYLLLREGNDYVSGINCAVANLSRLKEKLKHPKKKTCYTGFTPCDIQEYISHKHPFIHP